MTEGQKHDSGKLRWSLLPRGSVAEIIKVLEFGAAKYGAYNWQTVPNASTRYYDAMMRHIVNAHQMRIVQCHGRAPECVATVTLLYLEPTAQELRAAKATAQAEQAEPQAA